MPEEITEMMLERMKQKEKLERQKVELNKWAEEQLLSELRLAEAFYQRGSEFEQTKKGNFILDLDDDDDMNQRSRGSPPPRTPEK